MIQSLLGRYAIYLGNLREFAPRMPRRLRREERQAQELRQLEKAVEDTQKVLREARAVFPFDLFPDIVTVDRKRITVVHRNFFGIRQTMSAQHPDVKNIQADLGPFFGSLTITSKHFANNTLTIHYLWRKDAVAIQELMQGIIIAHRDKLALDDIDDKKLAELLTELGRSEAAKNTPSLL